MADETTQSRNEYLRSLKPIDPGSVSFSPIPAPIESPPSAVCSLSLIRTGSFHKIFARMFVLRDLSDDTYSPAPCNCFLIEKEVDGKTLRIMFELGLRSTDDPMVEASRNIREVCGITYTPGVARILEANGIPVESINVVVIGHAHMDHVGYLAPFPPSTELVVGPGQELGAHLAEEMEVPLSTLEERRVRALSRTEDKWETIGAFKGVDWFGDGSFWILDTPGHKIGHVTALVRTALDPPAYHLLGSDTAHVISLIDSFSPGVEHPRAGLYLSSDMDPSAPPGELRSHHADLETAYVSMAQAGRMDLDPNVNVWLSHDPSMDVLFPPGDFFRITGTYEELVRFKSRDRSAVL